MSHSVKVKNTLLSTAIAASVFAGVIAAAPSAEAMILHNCTDQPISVVLEGKPSGPKPSATIPAFSKRAIHATKAFGPYRIVVPALGRGGWFSNRKWDGTYSLKISSGGNIGLRNGYACPPAEVSPTPAPDYDDVRNRSHIRWCLRKYRSYNPETNEYRSFSGSYRECISPYI